MRSDVIPDRAEDRRRGATGPARERHRLLPHARTDDLTAIADGLVALHSTDPVTVYLSAMVRMVHPSTPPWSKRCTPTAA